MHHRLKRMRDGDRSSIFYGGQPRTVLGGQAMWAVANSLSVCPHTRVFSSGLATSQREPARAARPRRTKQRWRCSLSYLVVLCAGGWAVNEKARSVYFLTFRSYKNHQTLPVSLSLGLPGTTAPERRSRGASRSPTSRASRYRSCLKTGGKYEKPPQAQVYGLRDNEEVKALVNAINFISSRAWARAHD
jgi:hypothetical protein